MQGSGWKWVGEEAAGDERAWLRGRLRTVDGVGMEIVGEKCGAWLRGRLRTGNGRGEVRRRWDGVQGSGWNWVGRRSRW